MKRNAAREALNRAVNKAIADGSPVFVNQRAMPTTHRYERNVNPSIGKLNVCLFCSEPFQHPNHIATGSLPYVCEIVSADGEVEISTNVASVSEAVQWLRDNGISIEQTDAVPRVDYCIFRYQRQAPSAPLPALGLERMTLKCSGREVVEIQRDGYKEVVPVSGGESIQYHGADNGPLTNAEWDEYSRRTVAANRRKLAKQGQERVERNRASFQRDKETRTA